MRSAWAGAVLSHVVVAEWLGGASPHSKEKNSAYTLSESALDGYTVLPGLDRE